MVHNHKSDKDKSKNKRKAKEEEKEKKVEDKVEATQEPDVIDEQRLYVMNLPFTITHDELRDLFSRFGEIEDTEVPLRRGGTGFGFAFIRFATIEGAIGAFAELDKTYFQGRKLHILPAQAKPPKPIEELAIIPEEEVLVPIENAEEAVQQASDKPVE